MSAGALTSVPRVSKLGVYPVDSWRFARYALIAKLRRVSQSFCWLATVFHKIALKERWSLSA